MYELCCTSIKLLLLGAAVPVAAPRYAQLCRGKVNAGRHRCRARDIMPGGPAALEVCASDPGSGSGTDFGLASITRHGPGVSFGSTGALRALQRGVQAGVST